MTGAYPLGIAAASRALAAGEVRSVELTEHCRAALEREHPRLHVIARLEPDGALRQAEAADTRRRRGRPLGALDGIPLAHKDIFFRAGVPCASGSLSRVDFVPDRTAHVIRRLDAAGAVDLGRLQMVEIALGPTGLNPAFGSPKNPWNPDYIPGGSSSGPAVAVAAGLVPGALGSDTGGSIRTPAACCGIVGLKPTFGAVSRAGVLPLSFSLDHVGPLTRSVEDARLLYAAIAGQDPDDPWSAAAPSRAERLDRAPLRLGVPRDLARFDLHPEVGDLLEASIDLFSELGLQVVPVDLDWFDAANSAVNVVLAAEASAIWRRDLEATPAAFGLATRERLAPGFAYAAVDYVDALRLRSHLIELVLDGMFRAIDLLALPILPVPVPTVEAASRPGGIDYVAFAYPSRAINLLGLPALALPMGRTSNGLPNGLQLVGPPHAETLLFGAGERFQQAHGTMAVHPVRWGC